MVIWNDINSSLYHKAYFDKYDNTWTHGDYISINERGGVIIYGRSDSTLNPGGVRIGTAEIYKVVENINYIIDSVAIGKNINKDEKVILFVKTKVNLDALKIEEIKTKLKEECSPRHVPYKIIQVEDIPYTLNGKKVEIAVKKTIEGKAVLNTQSIANPESLIFFKKITI